MSKLGLESRAGLFGICLDEKVSEMITVALRFSENFAPREGTIVAHEQIINKNGYVWYGKIGTPLSAKVCASILENDEPRILLIQSGGIKRYWGYIKEISHEQPDLDYVPSYYHDKIGNRKPV